jgi:hypothetical protein
MATLEERIQNLTQDINPMGAMSDMDREDSHECYAKFCNNQQPIMEMVGKTLWSHIKQRNGNALEMLVQDGNKRWWYGCYI